MSPIKPRSHGRKENRLGRRARNVPSPPVSARNLSGAGAGPPLRFVEDRPADIRKAKPWHRYAHHIRTLPARLEALVPDLLLPPDGSILDYGCAELPYRSFFPGHARYAAADLPG